MITKTGYVSMTLFANGLGIKNDFTEGYTYETANVGVSYSVVRDGTTIVSKAPLSDNIKTAQNTILNGETSSAFDVSADRRSEITFQLGEFQEGDLVTFSIDGVQGNTMFSIVTDSKNEFGYGESVFLRYSPNKGGSDQMDMMLTLNSGEGGTAGQPLPAPIVTLLLAGALGFGLYEIKKRRANMNA